MQGQEIESLTKDDEDQIETITMQSLVLYLI